MFGKYLHTERKIGKQNKNHFLVTYRRVHCRKSIYRDENEKRKIILLRSDGGDN